MIKSLLVANRGEIACRVIKTAKRLGIETVAIYSQADSTALHVEHADRAFPLAGINARDSYLDTQKILDIAREAGVDAVHPGYGFLSENPEFCESCAQNNLIFIGPDANSIRQMGSKSAAKKLMGSAGVPLVPGYHGDAQDEDTLIREAQSCGFPLLIKASAGGGGKGMRVVENESEFAASLSAVKRESMSSFGDDHVLLEKYLIRPRHIEIQVFGDKSGNHVHLYERDCSIQRRHQKIIEEAPAPGLTPLRRSEMGKAAVLAAKAINYVGAGTVEFIVDSDDQFYFMEMNTRLQVEHPVTEMITGLDLVEWQISVASGDKLLLSQEEIPLKGHSIEARIYAENTDAGFLPATGLLELVSFPAEHSALRVETGIRSGDEITIHYDPMIAKIIAYGETRVEAAQQLIAALNQTALLGVINNIEFLKRVLNTRPYREGSLTTGFIEDHAEQLLPNRPALDSAASEDMVSHKPGLAGAMGALFMALTKINPASARTNSAWCLGDGWRLNAPRSINVLLGNQSDTGMLNADENIVSFRISGGLQRWTVTPEKSTDGSTEETSYIFDQVGINDDCNNRQGVATIQCTVLNYPASSEQEHADPSKADSPLSAEILLSQHYLSILLGNTRHQFSIVEQDERNFGSASATGDLLAPMPGKVIKVLVEIGASVIKGDALMILEAMKMEHTITAPTNGTMTDLYFKENEPVEANAKLLAIESDDKTQPD